jgi:Arc/MetJ-type ribon-helix-helix transcriptional regulator
METLNVKVDRETKEKLETLVRRKLYRNTSEAVRNMLADHMQEHPDLFASAKLAEASKEAESLTDDEFEVLAAEVFRGPKTAAQIVAEGRDRLG